LGVIKPIMESHPDLILVNEGANTLDEARDLIDMSQPRHRIDCATWAIMGMGLGSAIGAAIATGKSVVALVGDSAFGFSGMEMSTICRFRLPITVCVLNNGGIYNGVGETLVETTDPAPTTLDINAHYEKIGETFGADCAYVTTPDELREAFTKAVESCRPNIINVQLAANAGKESGHIGYLNPTPLIHIKV
jgi:oxalyl-CoA decarboxylase